MPRLGAHMSIAGGVVRALERGADVGCETIQIFTKNNMQWNAPPISPAAAAEFRHAQAASGIAPVFAHTGYLINLGAANPRLREKSIMAMTDELQRADLLGLPFVVTHPGAHMGAGEAAGLRSIAASFKAVLAATRGSPVKVALETTAGQGSHLGYRFEHLAELMQQVGSPRLAVCVDTCHIFAAGYEIRTRAGYEATMRQLTRVIGLRHVVAVHLNDSKTPFGSRVDRHEHIRRGSIGPAAFRFLMKDPRFAMLPMVLETPKGRRGEEDRRNLRCLKSFCRPGARECVEPVSRKQA